MITTPSIRGDVVDVLSAGDAANSARYYLFVTSNSLGITGNTKRDG